MSFVTSPSLSPSPSPSPPPPSSSISPAPPSSIDTVDTNNTTFTNKNIDAAASTSPSHSPLPLSTVNKDHEGHRVNISLDPAVSPSTFSPKSLTPNTPKTLSSPPPLSTHSPSSKSSTTSSSYHQHFNNNISLSPLKSQTSSPLSTASPSPISNTPSPTSSAPLVYPSYPSALVNTQQSNNNIYHNNHIENIPKPSTPLPSLTNSTPIQLNSNGNSHSHNNNIHNNNINPSPLIMNGLGDSNGHGNGNGDANGHLYVNGKVTGNGKSIHRHSDSLSSLPSPPPLHHNNNINLSSNLNPSTSPPTPILGYSQIQSSQNNSSNSSTPSHLINSQPLPIFSSPISNPLTSLVNRVPSLYKSTSATYPFGTQKRESALSPSLSLSNGMPDPSSLPIVHQPSSILQSINPSVSMQTVMGRPLNPAIVNQNNSTPTSSSPTAASFLPSQLPFSSVNNNHNNHNNHANFSSSTTYSPSSSSPSSTLPFSSTFTPIASSANGISHRPSPIPIPPTSSSPIPVISPPIPVQMPIQSSSPPLLPQPPSYYPSRIISHHHPNSSSISHSSSSSSPPLRVPSDPDDFSSRNWHISSTESLLLATDAIDECCRAIVATNNHFKDEFISAEVRRLALTVAVFERSLYAYALRISSHRQATQNYSKQMNNYNNNNNNANNYNGNGNSHPHAPFYPQGANVNQLTASATSSSISIPNQQNNTIQSNGNGHSGLYHNIPSLLSQPLMSDGAISSSPSTSNHSSPLVHSAIPSSSISPTNLSREVSGSSSTPKSTLNNYNNSTVSTNNNSNVSNRSILGNSNSHFPSTTSSIRSSSAAMTVGVSSSLINGPSPSPSPASSFAQSRGLSVTTVPPPSSALFDPGTPTMSPFIAHSQGQLYRPKSQIQPIIASGSPKLQGQSVGIGYGTLPPTLPLGLSLSSESPLASSRPNVSFEHSSALSSSSSPSTSFAPFNTQQQSQSHQQNFPFPKAPKWHQPAGMVCLLKLLTRQLILTRSVLRSLNSECSSFPRWILHVGKKFLRSLSPHHLSKQFTPTRITIATVGTVATVISVKFTSLVLDASIIQDSPLFTLRSYITSSLIQMINSPLVRFFVSFLPNGTFSTLFCILSTFMPSNIWKILREILRHRSAFIVMPTVLFLLYRRSLHKRKKQLKVLHSRLGLLLRLWHICFSLLDHSPTGSSGNGNGNGNESGGNYNSSLTSPPPSSFNPYSASLSSSSSSSTDVDVSRVPISRWMLELVPPELDASFWYHHHSRLSFIKYSLDVLYCSVNDWYSLCGERMIGVPYLMLMSAYYLLNPQTAAIRSSTFMSNPDIRVVKVAFSMMDSMAYRKFVTHFLPAMGWSSGFAIYKEIELRDFDDNESGEMSRDNSHCSLSSNSHSLSDSSLSLEKENTLKVILLSAKPLNMELNSKFLHLPSSLSSSVRNLRSLSTPVVIYLHGGGFVTDFRASHLYFLQQWSSCGVPILYVNYNFSHAYPSALNECYELYKRVAEGKLGMNATKIILVGDSTGGNLAAAVTIRAIFDRFRIPDAVILAYPILNLKLAPTPSRSLYMMDAVLPMNLLLQCRSLYLPSHCDADQDPCLSPVIANDEILSQWPPTNIMVGSFDPFIDDSVDFAHRLFDNGVKVKLKIMDSMPHSFLDFAMFWPEADKAVKVAGNWIAMCAKEDKNYNQNNSNNHHSNDNGHNNHRGNH